MQLLHIAHDAFFYTAYALAVLILLHRALRQAIAPTPAPIKTVAAPVPAAPVDPIIDASAPQPEPGAIAASTPAPVPAPTPVAPFQLPPIRQLKRLAKGRVKNYSGLTQGQLYQALSELGAIG